jgi:hypothetical protein
MSTSSVATCRVCRCRSSSAVAAVRTNTRSAQRSARRSTSLLTYVDTCELGIDVDTGAIPDYAVFHDVIVPGFDDVLALAS